MITIINTNSSATINLTQKGKTILIEHYEDQLNGFKRISSKARSYVQGKINEINNDSEITLQLWEIMNIFGSYLYNGGDIPFKDNIITFKTK